MKIFKLIIANIFLMIILIGQVNASFEGKKGKSIWLTNFEQAMKQSKEKGKPLLMSFSGSDWCKPCIKLTEEVFETKTFQTFAKKNFILLRLDFPRQKKNRLSDEQVRHNEKLAEKYNKEGAFPIVLILDLKERVIAKTGYRKGGPEKYIMHLKSLMSEYRTSRTNQ